MLALAILFVIGVVILSCSFLVWMEDIGIKERDRNKKIVAPLWADRYR